MDTDNGAERRSLPFPVLIAVIVAYLAVIFVSNLVSTAGMHGLDYGRFRSIHEIIRALVIPVALSVAFCIAVIQGLGWWKPVLRQDPPVQRWVLLVPLAIAVAIAAGTDYGTLGKASSGFVIWLLLGAMLVGLGEELMFRGIVVAGLRMRGARESRVALWSSVLFGAAHTMNWFADGGGHVAQVFLTIFMGWFLYLTRRATRGIIVPVLLHGLWDFGLFSGMVTNDIYAGAIAFIAVQAALIVLVVVRRKRVEPAAAVTAGV